MGSFEQQYFSYEVNIFAPVSVAAVKDKKKSLDDLDIPCLNESDTA